jgi:acetoacetyl-CoA reductase
MVIDFAAAPEPAAARLIATKPFTGRVALVTGGTRGIGLAITRALAEEGAHVAAGFCECTDAAARCESEHRDGGASISTHRARVEERGESEQLVKDVIERFGRIDFLINNAGITIDRTLRKLDYAAWQRVLDVNLTGAFNMTKAVLEHMIERGSGRIINISSVIGTTGNLGQTNYAASKAGLVGFTKSLALEVASKGITVNAVAPGFVRTEMVEAMPREALARIVERIPSRRLGEPEEVAHAVRFLCHDASAYITGSVLHVNGGLAMP